MGSAEATGAIPTRIRVLRSALAAVILGGTALVIVHDWLDLGGSAFDAPASGWLYDAVVIAGGLACLLRAAVARNERGAWIAIGAAVLSWGAAEVYWTAVILHDPSPPYPSPADIGYLAFYPLAAVGLVLLVRSSAHQLDWRLWMDGLIATLGAAALGAVFIFDFVADRTDGTTIEVVTTLAYPVGDILLLSLVVGVIALARWRPGRTWWLLLGGLAALIVADVAYTLQSNGAAPSGVWIDPIYLVAAVCLGAEAWQPRIEEIPASARFDGWRELMVPAFIAAVMIGLFAMQYFSATSGLATVLWAATMIAVIVRLAISVRENRRLLEQVQTDSLTGLRNRGRLQIDLERVCAAATPGRPASLVFLDLNGFTKLNDTLGHPAGDELLVRIGERLREAVGGRGTAYRTGGDEFCVLLTCTAPEIEPATRRAVAALTESGPGYDVAASWGAAAIPAEADSPSSALQLADVRMYALKERHRAGEVIELPTEGGARQLA
jgi:two-component system cell cycle response regulator